MRKVNKIVSVISRLILTARAIDVTEFPINLYVMTGPIQQLQAYVFNSDIP